MFAATHARWLSSKCRRQIQANDVFDRVSALILSAPTLDARLLRSPVPIAPVEDLALMEDDRLANAIGFDVSDQFVEFGADHHRERIGDRVRL
jgi:hypothetical protein